MPIERICENIIEDSKKTGLISDRPWYSRFCCGECIFFTGEECNATKYEGSERYVDSQACNEFENIEEDTR